jgi:recombination protein RecR
MAGNTLPASLEELIGEFNRLPGIGRKTATRLAFYVLNISEDEANELAHAIRNVKDKVRFCSECFHLAEQERCYICTDSSRNTSQICVVEDPSGILMLERTNEYHGLYHVLGGVISPLDGISSDDLHIKELLNRLTHTKEVILALNPSTEGEATSLYLSRLIKPMGIKLTRLASGIPLGSHLEFVDELTLSKALRSRIDM